MDGPLARPDRRAIVIAHRGASAYAPEHTHAAWELALDMGADYIEQDLQMTRDGVLVVLHDETLQRTTGGACTGRVIDHTLEEIRGCSAGAWFNAARPDFADARFADERIPTLAEVLERYAGRARFYIETKNPGEAPGMEEALVALLRTHGLEGGTVTDGLPEVIIQSFSAASLQRVAELAPELPRVQLLERESPARLIAAFDSIARYARGLGPSRLSVDPAFMRAAAEHGLAVHPYTANEDAEIRRLLDLGVQGLFTDRPDVALSLR